MTLTSALRDAALRWIADDPDPATRAELQRVLAAAMVGTPGAAEELADRMSAPLRFGTAGLRGPVRAGPAGMNVAVVRRATAGLAAWLVRAGGRGGTVVVGRDARHGSATFAAAAAEVLAGAGFAVRVLPGPLPTPVMAFAVRELGARGRGADHRVAQPAGGQRVQGLPGRRRPAGPAGGRRDRGGHRRRARPRSSIPTDRLTADAVSTVDVTESYLDRVARLPRGPARGRCGWRSPRCTAWAGPPRCGRCTAPDSPTCTWSTSQAEPDPDFPTVAFPNPEEPGAADALLATAAEVDADLAVALDPDADRCALAVPDRDGRWRMLTGDETGALLGDHLLRSGDIGGRPYPDPLVATTVVSSSMLRSIAAAHGARYAETLTGFKWIVRGGPGLVYGYEEAIGYCVDPDAVRDKDGIAAAVLACDLAAGLKAAGRSLLDRLDELAVAHGVHRTAGLSRAAGAGGPGRRCSTAAADRATARLER